MSIEKLLKVIVDIAKNIIVHDESNFFAAMILGITLAETNRLSEAKDIFNTLLESCQQNKNILLNMAQLEILNVINNVVTFYLLRYRGDTI